MEKPPNLTINTQKGRFAFVEVTYIDQFIKRLAYTQAPDGKPMPEGLYRSYLNMAVAFANQFPEYHVDYLRSDLEG